MKKILLVLSTVIALTGCNEFNLFTKNLTPEEKDCRSDSAEVAFQMLAKIDPELTNEKFDLNTTIEAYKNKGCSAEFIKNALNGMTSSK